MTDTDRLRDLLEQAAPASPDLDPTTRAATVARRGRSARTRDRALIGAAAVAVVAVAVVAPLTLGGGDEPDTAAPADPTAQQCVPVRIDTRELGPVSGVGDAVAVRSCPVVDPGYPLPDEPLVGDDAQAFLDDLAALPPYQLPSYCMVANVAPDPWALQFQTSGGGLVTVGSPMRICASVSIDGIDRGVGEIVAAFEGNLDRQQSGVPALACPTGDRLANGAATWNASFDPATATAGIVCYRVDPMGERVYAALEGTLDPGQLATVRDDLAANLAASEDAGMCIDTGPQRMVVLADAEGDQVAYVDDRCSGEFAGPHGFWRPSAGAEQAIGEALGLRFTG